MSKTLLFISQRAYTLYDFSPYTNKEEFRLVAVLEERYYKIFPENLLTIFSKIYRLPDQAQSRATIKQLEHDRVEKIVVDELALLDNHAENMRIICIDEYNMLLAGTLRDKFHIPGASYAGSLLYRDKIIMKTALAEADVRVPKFLALNLDEALKNTKKYYDDLVMHLGNDIIIKPVSGAASTATERIKDFTSFQNYLTSYQNEPVHFEVEEYISGDVYHCDSVIHNGKIIKTYHAAYNAPPMVSTQGKAVGSIQLLESNPIVPRCEKLVEQALHALGLIDGVTHLELFHSTNDEIIFLEVAARVAGGLTMPMYCINLGVMLSDVSLSIAAGTFQSLPTKDTGKYGFWYYFPNLPGEVVALNEPKIESKYEMTFKVKPGDVIKNIAQSQLDSSAHILVSNSDYDKLNADFLTLSTFKPLTMK